ncbi:hypothetical protein [Halobacillus sp. A5]|uniref:hypothetical protein n=1 Tax=Halobacillus sp. A5 TaxID=2880263 RepID=UPI0020A6D66C|nr:hypothetical protein [Halobacillus sp. A5]MCP3027803.1 hypothetical protein [Halobacillus sp. A5]
MSDHHEDDKPINDAVEHKQKIEGYTNPSERKLPLPIRLIGYFLFGGIALMILFGLIGSLVLN